MGKDLMPFEIALKGKLITSLDPSVIGENFQSQINMRPSELYPEGIGGMKPINSTALVNSNIKSGFHFNKTNESHILVHAYDSTTQNPKIYRNSGTIPSSSSFNSSPLFTCTNATGVRTGIFSAAPSGSVVFCDGKDSLIWGGNEFRVGGFINYKPDLTLNKDYTELMRNSLTDSQNIATLLRWSGADSYTKLLMHFTSAGASDSSTNTRSSSAKTCGTTVSLVTYYFATGSRYFDGTTNARIRVVNSTAGVDDFNISAGVYTVDFRMRSASSTKTRTICTHKYNGSSEGWILQNTTARELVLKHRTGAATTDVICKTSCGAFANSTWHHVALVQDVNSCLIRIYVDGNTKAAINTISAAGTTIVWAGASGARFTLGVNSAGTQAFKGHLDELRISNGIARWTSDFSPPVSAYGSNTETYMYLGATRPIKGFKFYIPSSITQNTASATMQVYYWSGSGWVAVSNLVDNTVNLSTTSLNQTGTVTFDSTVSTAKVRSISGVVLYWYRVIVTGADDSCQVSQVTIDTPMQQIKDIWDGAFRPVISLYINDGGINKDYSSYVSAIDWSSSAVSGYSPYTAPFNKIGTSDYALMGFLEPMMGVYVVVPGGFGNSNAAYLTVYYSSDGSTWTAVSALEDGTAVDGKSFNKSGLITWNPVTPNGEFKQSINNDYQLYYYKFKFSAALTTTAGKSLVDFVQGLPSPKTIRGYKFAMLSKDRVWLLNNEDDKANSALCSAMGTGEVWNGDDSREYTFGDEKGIIGGISLYSALAGNIYDVSLFFKHDALFGITGSTPQDFTKYEITITDGLAAPKTLKRGIAYFGDSIKPVVIWQGFNGLYMFDNRSETKISADIDNFFDKRETTASKRINPDYIDRSEGHIDELYNEYHWLFADMDSSGKLNREMVFSLNSGQWYEVDRGSSGELQCIFGVKNSLGNDYTYGCRTGIMERLETTGGNFDGNAIAAELWTGDISPDKGRVNSITALRKFKLITKSTTDVSSSSITVRHYVDGNTTASSSFALTPFRLGHRILTGTNGKHSLNASRKGIFHSVRMNISTTKTVYGFSPIYAGGHLERIREDL